MFILSNKVAFILLSTGAQPKSGEYAILTPDKSAPINSSGIDKLSRLENGSALFKFT